MRISSSLGDLSKVHFKELGNSKGRKHLSLKLTQLWIVPKCLVKCLNTCCFPSSQGSWWY